MDVIDWIAQVTATHFVERDIMSARVTSPNSSRSPRQRFQMTSSVARGSSMPAWGGESGAIARERLRQMARETVLHPENIPIPVNDETTDEVVEVTRDGYGSARDRSERRFVRAQEGNLARRSAPRRRGLNCHVCRERVPQNTARSCP